MTRRSSFPFVAPGVALGLGLALVCFGEGAGCYDPKLGSGSLLCASAGTKACPDGFACVHDVCVAEGVPALPAATGGRSSASSGGSGGAAGGAGVGVDGGGADAGAPGPDVAPDGSDGQQASEPVPARQRGDTCLISLATDGAQSDDCDDGLVCVVDCGGSLSRCHALCDTDADCPDSVCTSRVSAGKHVCDVPFQACNPLDGQTGCLAKLDGCYLLSDAPASTGGDRSVCDCSLNAGRVGEPCSDSRACARGLLCPAQGSGLGGGYCQHVCDPQLGDAACETGTCHPYGARWGFCF